VIILKNNKGFSLIELILSLAILVIVITLSSNFLLSLFNIPVKAQTEYDIQHEVRMLSKNITSTIRDASATFALHRTDHNNLTEGWNYIIPTTDNKSIVKYQWDEDNLTHQSIILVESKDGITFDLAYEKTSSPYEDNLLEFNLNVNINGHERDVVSEVEALNSLQVIDRGSSSLPANALAYRTDPRPSEVSDNKAAVAFVLDTSGSMGYRMDGNTNSNDNHSNPDRHSRIKKMRNEAKRLIESLSENPNIYASIIPFESTANGSYLMEPVRVNDTASSVMIDKINSLSAYGGTNTGDGIRRGYHTIKQFNDNHEDWDINNFMVILVDGVTTFYSAHQIQDPGTNLSDYNFVEGSSNIDNDRIYWWYDNYYNQGRYGGSGNSLDHWGTQYVNLIGDYVKDYGDTSFVDKKPIKVYVIGFSAVSSDHGSLNDIANATGADGPEGESDDFYTAGDSAALESIFDSIQKDINDSLWHIGGPN